MGCKATAGLMVWHVDKGVCSLEPALAARFGVPHEGGAHEVATQTVVDLIHPDDRERAIQAGADSLQSGAPFSITFRSFLAGGRVGNVHQLGWWIEDGSGERRTMMSTVSISEVEATAGNGAFVKASSLIGLVHRLAVDEGWRDIQHLSDVLGYSLISTIKNSLDDDGKLTA